MGERDAAASGGRGSRRAVLDYRIPARQEPRPPTRVPRYTGVIVRYAILCALAALFLMPFLWMVGTSLTPAGEVIKADRPLFPSHFAWGNYREALTVLPFHLFLKNTLTVAILCVIGQTFSAAL